MQHRASGLLGGLGFRVGVITGVGLCRFSSRFSHVKNCLGVVVAWHAKV